MEKFSIDFSLPNFIIIGLVGAFWYLLIVGTYQIAITPRDNTAKAA